MKKVLHFVASALVLLAAATDSRSQEVPEEKSLAIRQLVEMTGAMDVGQQISQVVVVQMSESLRTVRPDLPPEVFDALSEAVNEVIGENLPALQDLMIPTYDRYFSLEELEALIAFYQTELGRKVIVTLPSITEESMLAGQRWGEALAPQIQASVMDRLAAEGFELNTAPK